MYCKSLQLGFLAPMELRNIKQRFCQSREKVENVSYCQRFHVETMLESAFKSQHDSLLAMLCFKIYQQN